MQKRGIFGYLIIGLIHLVLLQPIYAFQPEQSTSTVPPGDLYAAMFNSTSGFSLNDDFILSYGSPSFGDKENISIRSDHRQDSIKVDEVSRVDILRKSTSYRSTAPPYTTVKTSPITSYRSSYIKSTTYRFDYSTKQAIRSLNTTYKLGTKNASTVAKVKASNRRKMSYRKYSKKMKRIR